MLAFFSFALGKSYISSPRTPATVEPIKSLKKLKKQLMSEKRKAAGKLQDKLAVARGSKLKAEQGGGAGGWVRRRDWKPWAPGRMKERERVGKREGGGREREREAGNRCIP